MKKYISELKKNVRQKALELKRSEVMELFNIRVKGDKLFLTLEGIAFKELPGSITADEITEELNKAKQAATNLIEL